MHEPAEPDAGDAHSIDSIVKALYAILSGPPGAKDWDRFAALFLPAARLVRVTRPDSHGGTYTPESTAQSMDVAAYRDDTQEMLGREAFYEIEIHRHTERFGSIAHVCSTFEARRHPRQPPFKRGLSSIQLLHDGRRWWIVSVLWQNEDPATPLPPRYLPGDREVD